MRTLKTSSILLAVLLGPAAACGGSSGSGLFGTGGACSCAGSGSGGAGSGGGFRNGDAGEDAGSALYCESPAGAGHECVEYSKDAPTTCPSGTTSVPSCPTADAIGACAIITLTMGATTTFYADSGVTPGDGQSMCTNAGGKWTAG
jgi:hypothetical protein